MSLTMYYGKECPHCAKMEELVKKLEAEEKISVERIEVWHNSENMQKLETIDKKSKCGGVPYFENSATGATLCGEGTYAELKTWAKGL